DNRYLVATSTALRPSHSQEIGIDSTADAEHASQASVRIRSKARSTAFGKRCSKSRMPTHSGRTEYRAMVGKARAMVSTQAAPSFSPRTFLAAAAYSGGTPPTDSTRTVPRMLRTLYGIVSV